jgi:hypothetical protein
MFNFSFQGFVKILSFFPISCRRNCGDRHHRCGNCNIFSTSFWFLLNYGRKFEYELQFSSQVLFLTNVVETRLVMLLCLTIYKIGKGSKSKNVRFMEFLK